MVTALRELATSIPNPSLISANNSMQLKDNALKAALPNGLSTDLVRGSKNTAVVAVQYALGRLGYLKGKADGSFGGMTQAAVEDFQQAQGLPVTGKVNNTTLAALDKAVSGLDLRPPAVKAADPLAYLSDFRRLGLPEIVIRSSSENFNWSSPEIRQAYGQFVGNYWQVMKRNNVEGDCKNLALFFMDQFRKQLAEDRMIKLPHPVLKGAPEKRWIVATVEKTQGMFSRVDRLLQSGIRMNRPGYEVIKAVQQLDPQHSLLYGVSVHYPEISANQVAKSCTRIYNWNPAMDNRGDSSKPEIPINQLSAGNMIFIDHTGNGSFDHTVTVVKVDKDTAGRTKRLILAVGSYDDVRDASSATSVEGVGLAIVNTYSEEVTVDFDTNGRVTKSVVTYASEPSYMVDSRYSARTTLMEQKPNGKLIVGRWA